MKTIWNKTKKTHIKRCLNSNLSIYINNTNDTIQKFAFRKTK